MNTLIRNRSDLRTEIFRLQQVKLQKQIELKHHFSSPSAVISTVFGLMTGSSDKDDDGKPKQDFVGFLSRFILPLVLNTTLFKGSGFLMKAMVGIASQKASTYISSDGVSSVFDKAKGFIGGLFSKKKAPAPSYRKIKKD